jgi:hypothetical protein
MAYPRKARQEDPSADSRPTAPATPGVTAVPPLPTISTRGGAPTLSAMPIGEPIAFNLPTPIAKITGLGQSGSTPDREMADLVNRVVRSTPLAQIGQTYAPFVDAIKERIQTRHKDNASAKPGAWERMFSAMPTEMSQLVTRQLFDRAKRPDLPPAEGRIADYMKGVDHEHERRAKRLGGPNG